MSIFELAALLITIAAVFGYLNHRYIRLPTTIGVMVIALIMSLGLIALDALGIHGVRATANTLLEQVDFDAALLEGMLSFLLFAGALHVNLNDLREKHRIISVLATLGVISSTLLVGTAVYFGLNYLGFNIRWVDGLLLGALISPTDPIAVLGILRSVGVPKSLETKIVGESLFNDGVGVVVFLVLLQLSQSDAAFSISATAWLFVIEVGGGILFGLLLGFLAFHALRSINSYQIEVMITLALVMGGYAAASAMHISGPLAMVVAGLLIGNHGRSFAMSTTTREHIDTFWELIDEILNVVLFVLIGLEMVVLVFSGKVMLAAVLLIPTVLLARWISVGIPVSILRKRRKFSPYAVRLLTWGGLRGGISIALALAIPNTELREIFLPMTYTVVVFSLLVQGLTIGPLVKKLLKP